MVFYKSKITGRFVTTNSPAIVADIFGKDSAEHKAAVANLEEVEDPQLVELIKHGNRTLAVIRYRGMYPDASVKDAMKVIRDIERKIVH